MQAVGDEVLDRAVLGERPSEVQPEDDSRNPEPVLDEHGAVETVVVTDGVCFLLADLVAFQPELLDVAVDEVALWQLDDVVCIIEQA